MSTSSIAESAKDVGSTKGRNPRGQMGSGVAPHAK